VLGWVSSVMPLECPPPSFLNPASHDFVSIRELTITVSLACMIADRYDSWLLGCRPPAWITGFALIKLLTNIRPWRA
jgi:hypothetical protein